MNARRIQIVLLLFLLVGAAGFGSGQAARAGNFCPDVYSESVRQADLEALHRGEAAADVSGDPGLGFLDNEAEAALEARVAGLELVLDNQQCFLLDDVNRARVLLPVAQEQLADHRSG